MSEVENVDVNPRWRMPKQGWIKINVHACFYENPLPNGNVSGIGAVARNSRGKILRMLAGSVGIRNRRVNDYQALLEGCKRAFAEEWEYYILECDHLDSFWEWRNSSIEGAHPDHADVVQQLNQRHADRNFRMEPTLCDPSANVLATYLVEHGAQNYKGMVVISEPFGRVFELWSRDMGLGSVEPIFMAVHEAYINPVVINEDAGIMEEENGGLSVNVNAEGERVEVIEILD